MCRMTFQQFSNGSTNPAVLDRFFPFGKLKVNLTIIPINKENYPSNQREGTESQESLLLFELYGVLEKEIDNLRTREREYLKQDRISRNVLQGKNAISTQNHRVDDIAIGERSRHTRKVNRTIESKSSGLGTEDRRLHSIDSADRTLTPNARHSENETQIRPPISVRTTCGHKTSLIFV